MKNKFTHYYPNNSKPRRFDTLDLAIKNAYIQINKHEVVEIRPPTTCHDAIPFGFKHKGSFYVGRNYDGKTFLKIV